MSNNCVAFLNGHEVKDKTARENVQAVQESVQAVQENVQAMQEIIPIACVIRPTEDGWVLLNDEGHKPVNVTGVRMSDGYLTIDHTPDATKVGSLCITPDETMVKYGLSAGASVGVHSSWIRFNRKLMVGGYLSAQAGSYTLANETGIKNPTYNTSRSRMQVQMENIYPGTGKIIPVINANGGLIAESFYSDGNGDDDQIQFKLTKPDGTQVALTTENYGVWVGGYIMDEPSAELMLVNAPESGNFWITGFAIKEVTAND